MFPTRLFADRFYALRYWCKTGAAAPVIEPGIVGIAITSHGCSTAITSHGCSVSVALVGGASVAITGDT